jgi:hypothetical protein
MKTPLTPQELADAAQQAAAVFASRGQADEWAVSRLMATRYKQQLTDEEE